MDYVAEANRTPRYNRASPNEPLRDEAGEIVYESHFFCRWLTGLQDGSFGLPPRVPRQLLETFDDRYGAVHVPLLRLSVRLRQRPHPR